MKTQQWLAAAVAENGALVMAGKKTRTEAETAGLAIVRKHPEFLEQLGAALYSKQLGKWLAEHASSGDLFQAQMFPDLPAVMRITPNRSLPVADMTGPDLDNARAMLWNRTGHMMAGAEAAGKKERAAFGAFFKRVRPHLTDGATVAEVLEKLAAQDDAA